MNRTILAAPVLALVAGLALALAGCGSESKSTGSTPDAPAAAATDAAAASAEFLATVEALIDPAVTPAEHVAAVAGGDDLGPTFTKLAAYMKEFPKVVFAVKNPVITGQTAKADIQITSNGSAFPDLYPAFYQQVDGHWKITRSGACSLMAVTQITCPELAAE